MLVNLSCNGEEMIAIHDVSTSRTKLILNVIKNNEIIQKINYEYPTESFENAVFVEKKFEIIHVNKEKIYQLDTTKLTVEKVKSIVWRYTFAYYNTKRVTTVNPDGLPPEYTGRRQQLNKMLLKNPFKVFSKEAQRRSI